MSPVYRPFDQERHLGRPPYSDSSAVKAWEEAHGHDVRLKCYPEFGCQAIQNENDLLWEVVSAAPRNLACERLPEKVALPPDVGVCGECEKCRFNAALARLDGEEES